MSSVPIILRRKCTPCPCCEVSWGGCGAERDEDISSMAPPGVLHPCCVEEAVLVPFLVPVWSLLHRGNLGKHGDQIPRLSKDHSQDEELVLLQLDAAAGSILPPACLRVPHLPLQLCPFLSQDLPSSLPRGLPAACSLSDPI